MKRTLVCFFALAAMALIAAAADVTGKWSGTFTPDGGDTQSAYLVLKQDGGTLTGTAGPDESQQWPIQAGKIDGSKVIFEVKPGDSEAVYRCELVLDGEHLKGDLTATRGDQSMKAKIDVTRVK